jgi:hypothetical protein
LFCKSASTFFIKYFLFSTLFSLLYENF